MLVTRYLRCNHHLFCCFVLLVFTFVLIILYHRKEVSAYSADIITSKRWPSLLTSTHVNCTSSQLENKTTTSTPDIWFSTFLLILIPSLPLGNDSRQLVRDTWFEGFNNSKDVALRFIVGTKSMEDQQIIKLTEENGTYGDIIFIDLKESYDALTNKTLALINWAHHHVKFSYLFKCDDDTYVFVNDTIVELKKRPTDTKLYYGNVLKSMKPARGKVKCADNNWNLGKHYIPYAMGGGYILSHDLVSFVSRQSPHLMWHINEDTAVGAWVSVLDHEQRSDGKFCFWWKEHPNKIIERHCKSPMLLMVFFRHTDEDVKRHFHYFHDHCNDGMETLRQYMINYSNTEIDHKV